MTQLATYVEVQPSVPPWSGTDCLGRSELNSLTLHSIVLLETVFQVNCFMVWYGLFKFWTDAFFVLVLIWFLNKASVTTTANSTVEKHIELLFFYNEDFISLCNVIMCEFNLSWRSVQILRVEHR